MHMPELDPRTALFFDSHLEALPLYVEFLCGVRRICPAVQEKVGKTSLYILIFRQEVMSMSLNIMTVSAAVR